MTTDAGSDEAAAGGTMKAELAGDTLSLFVHTFCMMHQASLAKQRQLCLLGQNFNDLAKVANVWRSIGTATQMPTAFLDFGLPVAKAVAKRVPPRAVRGRWGNVDASAAFLLKAVRWGIGIDDPKSGIARVRAVWRRVIAKDGEEAAAAGAAGGSTAAAGGGGCKEGGDKAAAEAASKYISKCVSMAGKWINYNPMTERSEYLYITRKELKRKKELYIN